MKNKLNRISKFLNSVSPDAVLCAENTVLYGVLLVFLCNQLGVKISIISGYTIKHSLGMVKGKTDPIDAGRIREYGERFNDKLSYKEYETSVRLSSRRNHDSDDHKRA